MNELYSQWIATLQSANIKPLSDDTCCRLLAIVYVFGGSSEYFTHNKKLLADTEYAQKQLNLNGGLLPNAQLLPILQNYITELEESERTAKYKENGNFAFDKELNSWAVEFMKDRYNIKLI